MSQTVFSCSNVHTCAWAHTTKIRSEETTHSFRISNDIFVRLQIDVLFADHAADTCIANYFKQFLFHGPIHRIRLTSVYGVVFSYNRRE